MIKYYAKLSFTLPLIKEHATWTIRLLDSCKVAINHCNAIPSDWNSVYDDLDLVPAELAEHLKRIDPCRLGNPGIIASYEETGCLWIRHDGTANLDFVVALLQETMRKFPEVEARGFEWCADCSEPHVGAFGGGAVIVTKERSVALSTHDLLPILDRMAAERSPMPDPQDNLNERLH